MGLQDSGILFSSPFSARGSIQGRYTLHHFEYMLNPQFLFNPITKIDTDMQLYRSSFLSSALWCRHPCVSKGELFRWKVRASLLIILESVAKM